MTKGLVIFAVLIILVVAGFFLFQGDDTQSNISNGSDGNLKGDSLVSTVPAPGFEDVEETIVVNDPTIDDSNDEIPDDPGIEGVLVSNVPAPGFEDVEETIVVNDPTIGDSDDEIPDDPGIEGVQEFSLDARRFSYSPDIIRVSQGDQVKIIINNLDTTHGINIPELDVSGNNVVEFTADQKGTFNFYCDNYCGGGHSGMSGMIIIE